MNKLYCGAAKECITPPGDLLPDLYGLMMTHFGGVIDDLYVRVMIVGNDNNRVMFVSWDLDKAPIPEQIVPLLSEETGVRDDHIMYFGVHTHTAPLHSARPGDGPNAKAKQKQNVQDATNAYEEFLKNAVLKAAENAVSSMQPAKIGWSCGTSNVGEYRIQDYFVEKEDGSVERIGSLGSDPAKPIDHTLFVMRCDTEDGNPICFLVNHAVHSCVMILNNFDGQGGVGISADLAGQVSTLLENKFPGCVALWSSGAAGDINPVMMNQYNYADPETGRPCEFREVSSAEPAKLMLLMLSRRQFADVLKTNRGINCCMTEAEIGASCAIAESPACDVISHGPGKPMEYVINDDTEPYRVRLQAVRIGPVMFCGASGELYNSLGAAIQSVSDAEHTVIINHDRTLLVDAGYIIDDEGYMRCTRPDGSRDGVPGLRNTRMLPGHIKEALKNKASELFTAVKASSL